MSDRTADRAAVTYLRIADVAGSMRQQRHVLGKDRTGLDVHVAGERANRDVVAGVADVRQVGDATDVDQDARLGEAQLHQRQQAVPAGQKLGVLTMLADEADCLFGGTGTDVIEGGGNHADTPSAAQASTALTML